MKEKEHGSRVGRGHDRADQQRLDPIHAEQVLGDRAVTTAVSSTPAVASVAAGASTLRMKA